MRNDEFHERHLRHLIASLPDVPVSAHLWGQLLQIPQQPRLNMASLWALLGPIGRLGSATGFAVALAFGIWLGGFDYGAGDMILGFEPFGVL
ncbi:MAG: hypothetical protein WDO70_08230 [Alphaproteobacteria bacterium]